MIKIILFFPHSAGLPTDGRADKPDLERAIRLRFGSDFSGMTRRSRDDKWLHHGDQSQFDSRLKDSKGQSPFDLTVSRLEELGIVLIP
jgi:hypothetical protein